MTTLNLGGLHLLRGESARNVQRSGQQPAGYLRVASGDIHNQIAYDIPFTLALAPVHDAAKVARLRQTEEGHAQLAELIRQGVSQMPSALLTDDELPRISPWLLSRSEVVFTDGWLDAMNPY